MEAEKIGLDDFLARGGDAAQVLELASPTPPVPAQAPTSVADRLVKLVRKEIVELWHDQEGAGYATVVTESHGMQHLPCTDKPFVQWVRRVIHAAEGKSPSKDTISTVTATLESEAAFGSASHPTSHRIGHHGDSIWLNLANKGGEVVQIQAGSWKVSSLQECPIRFIAPGALPLPSPSRCGDLSTLRQFINAREDDQILIEAFMIGAFLKTGTLPILFVSGGQGSAKSTGSRLVRSVFDPSRAPLLPIPKDVKEMAYLLANNFVLAFDNASAVSHEISCLGLVL